MQAMNRRLAIAAVLGAALAASLLATAPASAGVGVGCPSGNCSISLSKFIHISGDSSRGEAHHAPVDVPEPPCLWNPIGDATTGSNAIIQEWQPDPPTAFEVDKSYAQAKKLVANPKPGEWYELPVNPAAPTAVQQECYTLPLYAWVPRGQTPPPPPIPPQTVALYAYNHMQIPLPRITISPRRKGYVNLGTYVWGNWRLSATTGRRDAYEVTATLAGTNVTVSVWAQASKFAVNATGHGAVYSAGCGPTGSAVRPVGTAPATAGAGQAPDCGVLWQGPDAAATVSATVTWSVTWGNGILNGPGPNQLPDITLAGRTVNDPVSEIQSINGGG
jgi:hypothetical protein